jgi:uncharacterized protein YraI
MTLRKFFTRGGLLMALLLWLAGSVLAQGGAARVRFVHVIPGAAALDVYINGALALKGIDYGAPTTYFSIPAGTHTVSITPSGLKTVLAEQALTLNAGSITTFIASDPNTLQFIPFEEKLGDAGLGKGRLEIINASAGLAAVDLQTAEDIEIGAGVTPAETTLIPGLAYNAAADYDLEAKTYPFQLAANGSVILGDLNVPVTSGTAHLLIVYGAADAPQTLLLTTSASIPSGAGLVRFINGIVGAPAVDVVVNDTLIAPALSTERATEHIGLPSGEHPLVLRVAGSDDVLFEGQIEVTAGAVQTIVILQGDTEIELQALDDAIGGVTAGSAGVTVINTIPGTNNIAVSIGGEPVGENVPFGMGSPAASLTPIHAPITLNITRDDMSGSVDLPATTFYGGVYYTLVALDGGLFSGPRLLIIPTAIAQGLASAPGAGTETIAVNAAPPTQITAAGTTPVETQVAAAETTAPEVPTNTPAPLATQDLTITGRVILDPGANLQLREFPSTNARSLGLAPSGTEFIVNGRVGAPVALTADGNTPTPLAGATDFVDPVTLLDPLDPKADLVAGDTWINVTYNTPDGGAIIAWVNAQYVDVRNARGEKVRLADQPMVGSNVPGEARSTAITPPPSPEDRKTALVHGLDAASNLNIRRTPETEGEVLGRVGNGAVLDLVGLNEAEEWAYVTFRPEGGGTVSGWVSVQYLKYQLNGQDITLDDLKLAKSKSSDALVYQVVPDDRRGAIGSGAETVALPTPDTLKNTYVAEVKLDPGANLQLRRDPNVDAESLQLVPSGTRVVVTGRTEAADWLFVSFEGDEGWISSRYVVTTYNGNLVQVDKIPVLINGAAATITPVGEGPAVVPTTDTSATPTTAPVEPTATATTAS